MNLRAFIKDRKLLDTTKVCYLLKKSDDWSQSSLEVLHYSDILNSRIIIQINHQPDARIFQFIILTFIYSSTCFGGFPAHHQELNDCSGSLWLYLRIVVIVVLCSWPAARPRTQHEYHHDTKVKPEASTALIELLMMGVRTPETRWAVNKCQDNKLENCCIWLVIYLNCTMMHGLTNLKSRIITSHVWSNVKSWDQRYWKFII